MAKSADPLLDRAEARIGESLRGKWTLDRLLGVGGMAAVFAATHRNGLRGAVKILHQELNAIEEIRKRFLREGYVANKVGHPGAVRVLDDDIAEDGSVFLVMELLEGQTIEGLAASRPEGRLSIGEVLAIGEMTLETLAAAHDRGIVHRDLKPENLFLTSFGELRVLDFGIARLREVSTKHNSFPTMAGATLGTPGFMPPEQARGSWADVDARADVWALGATLFTVLTGRRVHQGPTPLHVLAVSVTSPAPLLATVTPEVPEAVAAVIDRALAFEPRARWQSARAMLASVRAARVDHPFTFTATDIGAVEPVGRVHNTLPLAPEALPATSKPSTRPEPIAPPELTSGERPTTVRPAATFLPNAAMADPQSVVFDDATTNDDDKDYPPTLKGSDPRIRGGLAPPEGHAGLEATRRVNLAVIVGAALFALVLLAMSLWLASRRIDLP